MQQLTFYVNGELQEPQNVQPETSLAEYLRSHGLRGTKIACNEGGCGSCVVMVSSYDKKTKTVMYAISHFCVILLILFLKWQKPLCKRLPHAHLLHARRSCHHNRRYWFYTWCTTSSATRHGTQQWISVRLLHTRFHHEFVRTFTKQPLSHRVGNWACNWWQLVQMYGL